MSGEKVRLELQVTKTTKAHVVLDDTHLDAIVALWFRQKYPAYEDATVLVNWDVGEYLRGATVVAEKTEGLSAETKP